MSIVENIRAAGKARMEITEVECPEWPDGDGNPTILRFRTVLTVDDVLELSDMNPKGTVPNAVALFILLALDETGKRLVTREMAADGEGWFMKAAAGMDIVNIVRRADLVKKVNDCNYVEPQAVGQEGKP